MLRKINPAPDKNSNHKFKTQLMASFMGMTFIILLVSTVFGYNGILYILKNQTEQSTLSRFCQSEYNINTLRNETEKLSKLVIADAELQEFFENKYIDEVQRVRMINNIFRKVSQVIGNYDYIESIMFFGENGIILGSTPSKNIYLADNKKENWFYSSYAYKKLDEDNTNFAWAGGYAAGDFNLDDVRGGEPKRYITVTRKIVFLNRRLATLVVNIDERYFTSTYNNTAGSTANNMYIIDGDGYIISHRDPSKLYLPSPVFKEIDPQKSSGSFIIDVGAESEQVIYYKLKESNWILVNTIPLGIYIKDILTMRMIFIIVFISCLGIAFFISLYWIYRIARPLTELTKIMGEVEKGKVGITLTDLPKNEFGLLAKQFNKMSISISELIKQNETAQEEKRKREIYALQSQINPHFLYNTLNAIKWMAMIIKADNVVDSIITLGNIVRPIFNNQSIFCTIKEEIEYLINYIKIMNYRYGECITVNFKIPEFLLNREILRFILQPLVENSITHGMKGQDEILEIQVEGMEENNCILFTVSDNGKGMTEEKIKEISELLNSAPQNEALFTNGIGLVNVNRRLKLHFGEAYGIKIIGGKTGGTLVFFRIPKD